jgi:hypothetical protein
MWQNIGEELQWFSNDICGSGRSSFGIVVLESGIDCIGVLVQLGAPQIAVPCPEIALTRSLTRLLAHLSEQGLHVVSKSVAKPAILRCHAGTGLAVFCGPERAQVDFGRYRCALLTQRPQLRHPTTPSSSHDAGTRTPHRQVNETILTIAAVPKVFPHQAEACACAEAEPPHPSVDSPQDWQHHQVRPIAAPSCSRSRSTTASMENCALDFD